MPKGRLHRCGNNGLAGKNTLQCLEHIQPVSVARLILEKTEHICLAGEGAYNFAITNGFQPAIMHTEQSIKKYNEWKAGRYGKSQEFHTDEYKVKKLELNDDGNHDTIGMVAIDKEGHLSGACTTSGQHGSCMAGWVILLSSAQACM
jgi:N4-(beta-N-acetylglucosaminyl)-L-asparaginase